MTLAVDRGEHHHPEGLRREVREDQLHREEDPGEWRVERGGDPARGPTGDQHPHAGSPGRGPGPPSVEPSAAPICTIGPSRPTEPPPPMQSAEASALTPRHLGSDAATPASDGEHHLGHAVPARLAGEQVDQRAVEQTGHDRRGDDEVAARPGDVRVAQAGGAGVVVVPGQGQGEDLDQPAEHDRTEPSTCADEHRKQQQAGLGGSQ